MSQTSPQNPSKEKPEEQSSLDQLLHYVVLFLSNSTYITLLSLILYISSIYLFINLPNDTSKNYVSEKNLQCGAEPSFNHTKALDALNYAESFRSNFPIRNTFHHFDQLQSAAYFIQKSLDDIGLETELQTFNSSHGHTGVNVIGILRCDRSLGTESIVLTTRLDSDTLSTVPDSSGSVGLFISLMKHYVDMATHSYCARDIIVVFSSEADVVSGMEVWLEGYHRGMKNMKRGGRIYAAISVENAGNKEFERLIVSPEGLGGALPNLDMINVVTTTSFIQNTPAGIDLYNADESLHSSLYKMFLFTVHTSLSFPRSNHGYFNRYGINSVAISCVHSQNFEQFLQRPCVTGSCPDSMPIYPDLDSLSFYKLARILEVVIHNLDNADELLHQSFRWYHLAGAVSFLDTGEAFRPFFPFLGLLLLQALSIYATEKSLVKGLPEFLSLIFSCVLVCFMPYFLALRGYIPNGIIAAENHSVEEILAAVAVYCLTIAILYKLVFKRAARMISLSFYDAQRVSWKTWKLWLLLHYGMVLGMLLLLNIQFAYLGSLLALPFFLVSPKRNVFSRLFWQMILLISNPIPLLFILFGLYRIGPEWIVRLLISSHNWGSFFYPFFVLVNVPVYLVGSKIITRT